MSRVIYITGFYSLFSIVFQLFCNDLVNRLNLKVSVIIGNTLNIIHCLIYIFTNNYFMIIIANAFGALGFTLKNISESSILYSSLRKLNKTTEFSKIEGKANSKYYYYEGFASLVSGFLFLINGYIPLILCLINLVIATIISIKFKNVDEKDTTKKVSIKQILTDTKSILTSNRLRSLYLYAFVFTGIVTVSSTLYKAVLTDVGIKDQYVTMIVCFVSIFIGIGAKSLFYVEKKAKNKTLTALSFTFIISLLFVGIIGFNTNIPFTKSIFLILFLLFMGFVQGSYRVALKKYTLSFTTHKIRNRITATYYIFENIGSTLFSFGVGTILNYFPSSIACIILAILSGIIISIILKFMSTRLGLRPEEYEPKDINNVKI